MSYRPTAQPTDSDQQRIQQWMGTYSFIWNVLTGEDEAW
jgi:hypothetical protein